MQLVLTNQIDRGTHGSLATYLRSNIGAMMIQIIEDVDTTEMMQALFNFVYYVSGVCAILLGVFSAGTSHCRRRFCARTGSLDDVYRSEMMRDTSVSA